MSTQNDDPGDERRPEEAARRRRDETPEERADRNWDELMQELRVMQTGSQVLLGFLLAIAFQPRFVELDALQHDLYLVLVALASLVTLLALAPVALHRSFFGRRRKPELVRLASRIIAVDLVAISALAIGVVAFIMDFTIGRIAGVTALVIGVVGVSLLWLLVRRLLPHTPPA